MKIHMLASGATVISLSPGHGFRFSDGTMAEAQDKEVCDTFTLQRKLTRVGEIKGMALNQVQMLVSEDQQAKLREIAAQADLIILPFPVLSALREQGVREQFPNCVAFNATPETQRSAPADKVLDVNNWSY